MKIVWGIVRPNFFYAYTKLGFDHDMKVWKDTTHIRFLFKKKDPECTGTIVNKYNKPSSS